MRAAALTPWDRPGQEEFLEEIHRLRARVFKARLGWDVQVYEGHELDAFDRLSPTYILAVRDDRSLAGCVRLLPATGPTMLDTVFPQLLGTGQIPSRSRSVETSRFCIDPTGQGGRAGGVLGTATLTLLTGLVEWSLVSGIDHVVTATDLSLERILRIAGWPMERLGAPRNIGGTHSVAGRLAVSREAYLRLRPPGYRSDLARPIRAAA